MSETDKNQNAVLDDLDVLVSHLDTLQGTTGDSGATSSLPARATDATGNPSDSGATGSLPARASKRSDAIDAILAGPQRTTAVKSLRDHETIQRFRKEFADGLIRVDTARQLLGLIRMAVETVMP